ncbi:MAG TPA: hypothetical protein VGE00_08735 [Gammaproteobacteria bacterium]
MRHFSVRLPLQALLALLITLIGWSATSQAMPVFARQYEMSCAACHDAFPRLNEFGAMFRDSNYRLPNWKEKIGVDTGDDMLMLPKVPQLAIRAQAYVQSHQAREVNSDYTGFTDNDSSKVDFQSPYLIKLLSSAPLSDHITYYFYGIFAEKGENGTTVIEDAWFRHDDAFGSGVGTMLGQFQVSDLMFPRETRMSFQDFMAYRFAAITYERGVILDRGLGPLAVSVGAVNGNGINANASLNSPGYKRPDRMFDNNDSKDLFGRVGTDIGPVSAGVFGLMGKHNSIDNTADPTGQSAGGREVKKHITGLDLSGTFAGNVHWYAQGLWTRWADFLDSDPLQDYDWFAGFAGVDYIHSPRWSYSLLYNYGSAGDLDNSGTIYEGINMRTLTFTSSYYFARNVKGIIELNGDFLKADADNYVGHPTKEGYVLMGFDAAF